MSDNITAPMAAALGFAHENGGKLERRAGGYWTYSGCPWNGRAPQEYVSTPTIEALVKRGRMTYTQWRHGRKGEFPIVVSLTETT